MKKGYEILLIVDNLALAEQIRDCLKDKASIRQVSDFEEAKALANQNNWHLVIIDVNANYVDCLTLASISKKTDSNSSVLIIAENIKVEFILKAMQEHVDGILFKPLNINEFTERSLQLAKDAKTKKSEKIILAIGAHPDDIEFGCGGTLAKLRSEGNSINLVTLSLGAIGGEPRMRKKEALHAAEYLEANLYLGNFVDTKIMNNSETILFLENIVREVQPTHVYTHSFHDSHQDHRTIYQATITACRKTHNIFSYQSPSSTTEFQPNIFINIDKFIDDKIKLLGIYESQLHIRPYLRTSFVRASAQYWGKFSNYQLVEPMEVIKGDN